MGLLVPDTLGRVERVGAMRETTFGTAVKLSAIAGSTTTPKQGAFLVMKSQFSAKRGRENRADKRATRSHQERITRMSENSWSLDSYLLPPEVGDTNRAPDLSALIHCAMGVVAHTGNDSCIFSLAESQTALGSLSLYREASSTVMEQLHGAWVEEMTVSGSGGNEPKISFSGGAKTHIHTGYSTVQGTASGTSLSVDNGRNFENGSIVQIGTSTGSDAGHTLSAKTLVSGTEYSFTVAPAITGSQADGLDVIPWFPATPTYNGSPIAGIVGAVEIQDAAGAGYVALDVVDASCTLKNNIKPLTNLAFYTEVPDVVPRYREISGEVTVRARRDHLVYLGTRKDFTTQDLRITFGSTTRLRVRLQLRVELEFGDLDIPESEEGYFKLPFFGQATAAGANEMTLEVL